MGGRHRRPVPVAVAHRRQGDAAGRRHPGDRPGPAAVRGPVAPVGGDRGPRPSCAGRPPATAQPTGRASAVWGAGMVPGGTCRRRGDVEEEGCQVLELQGLSRRYGDVVALDDLSFTVREGQMFGFVGPNGAGKTTTMRIVLGVLEPDRGEVRWRGRPVDAETRRRFGYMPEERGLYPKMRVRDQLEYF